VSTDDQKLTAVIQGEALKFARDEIPQELLDHLAAVAEGRDDLRTETAGHGRFLDGLAGYPPGPRVDHGRAPLARWRR
jgi:hypothetical protein